LLYPHKIRWQNNVPVPEKCEPERFDIPQAEPLRKECEHFLHSFVNGNRPHTDGREGLRVLKVLNAAQAALNSQSSAPQPNLSTLACNPLPEHGPSPVQKAYCAHETAMVDADCKIGAGTKIWHFSHVLSNSTIGEKCNIGQNVVIGPDVTIGMQCKIQNNVSVYKGVTLEDGVFCGPSMVFTNIYNPRAEIPKMDQLRRTLVKHGATIGANSTIVCGTTIGRYAFVGAGAVVTRDVPDHALMVGNPARQIGWVCKCGTRLGQDLICAECHKEYIKLRGDLLDKELLEKKEGTERGTDKIVISKQEIGLCA
jgi:UDP-2-acetamido-3-amino-2,3-dideoxy-glucuronate N-acetyltransferase